jgi:predicted Zn-dependent protease
VVPPPEPVREPARERARALVRMGRYPEGAAAAREALASAPDDAGLMVLLAAALCESGQADEALPVARQAVALRPDHAGGHRTLGWVTHKLGRPGEAADILAHALALDPHDPESHVMRAEVLLRLAHGTRIPRRRAGVVDEAERHAAEAVRLDPARAAGYLVHGKAAVARGHGPIAEGWARQALALEPDHPVGHQVLGLAAQIRGDTRTAADHYVEAGRLNPRSDASLKMLRGLRAAGPVSGLALFIILRIALATGRTGGGVVAAVVVGAGVVGLVLYRFVWPRWQAHRSMSDQARQALARDRRLRAGPLRSRLRRSPGRP